MNLIDSGTSDAHAAHALFAPGRLPAGPGPLYLRLTRYIAGAIERGQLAPGDALPSERDIAEALALARVTVRRALKDLVAAGILVQRHGSGTYVASRPRRVEQSLSRLTSFTEDMASRGMAMRDVWLDRGLYTATPDERAVLGLAPGERAARLVRLRLSGDTPLAIERASLAEGLLPDPAAIGPSLYGHLEQAGNRPVRAVQRIRAVSAGGADAALLDIPAGSPSLHIERTSYLASGRVAEFTRSLYRGDTYDFVAELSLGEKDRR